MQDDLFMYIQENFPNFWSDINIRFELGDPFDNGTDERINQVITRVTTLFEDIFEQGDTIHLYIKDWGNNTDLMFGNTTPDYLYLLLGHPKLEETIMYEHDEDTDELGNTIQVERPYKVKTLCDALSSIPYRDILTGIANYEQGRKPSIGQQVYFINIKKGIVFYMYDDRGCVIFSKTKERLQHMYVNFNNWLVDYWRAYFDSLFMENS